MTNAKERMLRVRLLMESIPKNKISKKKFVANFSLDYGLSVRTVEGYLQTLIDAERVLLENKEIRRA